MTTSDVNKLVDSQKHEPENTTNRGYDNKVVQEDYQNLVIGFQDVDTAIIRYINEYIKPYVMEYGNKISVPVIYGMPERWNAVQKNGVLLDKAGVIQAPIMMLRRTSMTKNKMNIPVNRYLDRSFLSSKWNRRNAYDRFAVLNNITPSQSYVSVTYPDYYDMNYECLLWTDKMHQMNRLIEQISFEVENYWGDYDNFKFKTSVESYQTDVNLPVNNDRVVTTKFDMKVNAYILPEDRLNKYGNPENNTKINYTVKKVVIQEKLETGE
ncbi:MAG: hypothetical protein VW683_00520 [Betaproteobacteria bacterium]|jgi:hypothetical protein